MVVVDANDGDAARRGESFGGWVIVRLKPKVAQRISGDLSDSRGDGELQELLALLDEFGVKDRRPAIRSVERERIQEWEHAAAESPLPPRRSLLAYWRLDCGERHERVPELLERLRKLPVVDVAYLDAGVAPAAVQPDPLFSANQGYLQAAPVGIDAEWAWLQPGGDGAAVGVADIEAGWNRNHQDLAAQPITILGDNRQPQNMVWPFVVADQAFPDWNHGTAVLGILAGKVNGLGITGAAPNVKSIHASSVWDAASGTPGHVVDALTRLMGVLTAGDVILLEVETARGAITGFPDHHPIEIKPLELDAIRLAVANRFVVVEAAGNGAVDLDQYSVTDPDGTVRYPLRRNGQSFDESGAIMVAAAESAGNHAWANPSNYGSRIDCYAWNDSIGTCGFGTLTLGETNPNKWYTHFGHTSGASAIVAGAAVLLQSMHITKNGAPLLPLTMRTHLSDPDPTKNTPPAPGSTKPYGVMPNLRGLSISLGLAPDVYLRDSVTDLGVVPSIGAVSLSPDIIVRRAAVGNPAALFAQGSGNENNDNLSDTLIANNDAFVYLRMRNRGGVEAANVVGRVWWSEPGTNLTNPANWHPIGQTNPTIVPVGGALMTAGPIDWPAALVPPAGHYCLVATLECPQDPAPDLSIAATNFESLIRNFNNITWRNFDVVAFREHWIGYEFFISGARTGERRFDLEVVRTAEMHAALYVPLDLGALIAANNRVEIVEDKERKRAKIVLPGEQRVRLREILLPADAHYAASFHVAAAKGVPIDGHTLAIRQLHRGLEVGRMTWRFATEPK